MYIFLYLTYLYIDSLYICPRAFFILVPIVTDTAIPAIYNAT